MKKDKTYVGLSCGSDEIVSALVADHQGWASSIARRIAQTWLLDWELDGLDGAANEALLFCSRRYDPKTGVPFRAYARKRIHEACTDEARKSKSWQRGTSALPAADQEAREISFRLFEVYPELREGMLPGESAGNEESLRASIKSLLASATLLTAFQQSTSENPENSLDLKRMVEIVAEMDAIHQVLLWEVYWQGQSMRALASTWGVDELAIMREHQSILDYVSNCLTTSKSVRKSKMKIRPRLRELAMTFSKAPNGSPFSKLKNTAVMLLCILPLLGNGLITMQTLI